ncbi:MAG: hypothetical protein ACR2MG_20890 [Pyrinomonadaceae bacterium]
MMVIYLVNSLETIKSSLLVDGNLFALPNGEIYRFGKSDELGGIKSFFSKYVLPAVAIGVNVIPGIGQVASAAIAAGIGIGGNLLAGGGGGGVAKGLEGINAFGAQVIDALNTLKTQAANLPPGEAATAADKLAALLSDSSKVYQAKKGKDAAALASFKQQAAQLAAEIKTIQTAVQAQQAVNNLPAVIPAGQTTAQTGGQTQFQQLPNGQIVAIQQPAETSILGNVSNPTLLIGVGIVGLILFLKR